MSDNLTITLSEEDLAEIRAKIKQWHAEHPGWRQGLRPIYDRAPTVIHIDEVIQWLVWMPEDSYQEILAKVNELRSKAAE